MSAPMEVHLWIREDGQEPKAIQAGTKPPGPGAVVAVRVSSLQGRPAHEARQILQDARSTAPEVLSAEIADLHDDGASQKAIDTKEDQRDDATLRRFQALRRVREVSQ